MKRTYLLLIVLSLACNALWAQIDTEFWFAAPDLEIQHAQTPVRFCVTTFDQSATVTFTQPANPLGFLPHTIEVPAHSYKLYDVSNIVDIVETSPYNQVLNYGFYINSSAPVSIYYESNNNNSEIYSLKGSNALGYEFLVPTQYTYSNHFPSTCSRAEMVATEDNTEITIIPSVALKGGIAPNQEVHVVLQKGQSYAVEANSSAPTAHLRNTRIMATKPIAVNTSDDSVDLDGHHDLVGDQLVPVSMMGTEYFAVKSGTGTEYLYFFPTEDATTISINGVAVGTLDVGEEMERIILNPVEHISADKPIAVFQLTVNETGEMGGTVLPHVHCTGSLQTSCFRPRLESYSQMFVTIVVKTEKIDGFFVNNDPDVLTASDFTPVPSNPEYSYCLKNLSNVIPVESLMNLENRAGNGYFHLGVFITSDGTCTYGFFSDYQSFSKIEIDEQATGKEHCAGDDITFNFQSDFVNAVHLSGPSGVAISQPPFVLHDVTSQHSGRYIISGSDATGCVADSVWDFIDINVHQVDLQVSPTQYYTIGEAPVQLSASGADRYEWQPTTGLSDPNIPNPLASPDDTIVYTVTGYKDFGELTCEASAEVKVIVLPEMVLQAVDDRFTTCHAEAIVLNCLENDLLANCQELTYEVNQPLHGSLNQDTWLYIPDSDFSGEDHFTYEIFCGERHSSAEAVVTVMPAFEASPVVELCGNDENVWHGMTFDDNDALWVNHGAAQSGCDSVYHLHFVHYPEYVDDVATDTAVCDYFSFQNDTIRESGFYEFPLKTKLGCDSIVRVNLTVNELLDLVEIYPADTIAPHWLIPATEFQVNSYDFSLYDHKHKYQWNSVNWYFEEPVHWVIDTTENGRKCSVYVLEHYDGIIHLVAEMYNPCSPEGEKVSYWLQCSFYDVEENATAMANFSVVPNPNHGEMTLKFENMQGNTNIKVVDMRGVLVDEFETTLDNDIVTRQYTMPNLRPGMYMFVATGRGFVVTQKVVVVD